MRKIQQHSSQSGDKPDRTENEAELINLSDHRCSSRDRFPDVDDLVERLTDDAASVANWD